MTNVEGRSIKMEMPTSQYGTLTVDGQDYLVHVTKMYIVPLPGGPPDELHNHITLELYGIIDLTPFMKEYHGTEHSGSLRGTASVDE